MTSKTTTVQFQSGVEARALAMLVQLAGKFDSEIHFIKADRNVNAKSIMGMMTLSLESDDEITITANGSDEADAVKEIEEYLTGK